MAAYDLGRRAGVGADLASTPSVLGRRPRGQAPLQLDTSRNLVEYGDAVAVLRQSMPSGAPVSMVAHTNGAAMVLRIFKRHLASWCAYNVRISTSCSHGQFACQLENGILDILAVP